MKKLSKEDEEKIEKFNPIYESNYGHEFNWYQILEANGKYYLNEDGKLKGVFDSQKEIFIAVIEKMHAEITKYSEVTQKASEILNSL